jgi:hypothetical protein
VQTPLYRHAKVTSYEKLTSFVRTLNSVASFSNMGYGAVSKNIATMRLAVDPGATEAAGGTRPTAVMLSRMICAVGRYVYT